MAPAGCCTGNGRAVDSRTDGRGDGCCKDLSEKAPFRDVRAGVRSVPLQQKVPRILAGGLSGCWGDRQGDRLKGTCSVQSARAGNINPGQVRAAAIGRSPIAAALTCHGLKFSVRSPYAYKPRRVGILRGDGGVEWGMRMDHKSCTVFSGDLLSPKISLLLKRG